MSEEKLTPVMQQYVNIKERFPDSILFFRLGDFYEMFFRDAEIVSEELDLTLTCRNRKSENPVPMAGVPFHSAASYINRLVRKSYKVAICEQVSEPGGKDIVGREVVRVVTPGTVLEEDALVNDSNNFICSLYFTGVYNLAYCDISTGEFLTTSVYEEEMLSELNKIAPSELLI
ncbi:MAG: DNA mismatch repair protein MutS, partial [Candidatus Muiribacteriaceae bacterium]